MHQYLDEHPQVFMSAIKETNFFAFEGQQVERYAAGRKRDRFPVTNLEDYQRLFETAGDAMAIGESSPLYMESPVAAANIRRVIPGAKIVVSLRHPADRAISGYQMKLRHGGKTQAPDDAFSLEAHCVQASFYYENLKRYYDLFPPEQIKVILFDDFANNPLRLMQDLYGFLDVDADVAPDVKRKHNVGVVPRRGWLNRFLTNRHMRSLLDPVIPDALRKMAKTLHHENMVKPPPVSPEQRRHIATLFREDVLRVQELIGRDLEGWIEP